MFFSLRNLINAFFYKFIHLKTNPENEIRLAQRPRNCHIKIYGKQNLLSIEGKLRKSRVSAYGGGNNIFLADNSSVIAANILVEGNDNTIHIEEGCNLFNMSVVVNGNGCSVTIGKNTTASGSGCLYIACMGTGNAVRIGKDCMIADYVDIWASDTHPILDEEGTLLNPSAPVTIGNHVWLGRYVKVLKGVNIGEGAIVGMGSLVTRNIAPHSLNAGSPSKLIRANITWDKGFITPYETRD